MTLLQLCLGISKVETTSRLSEQSNALYIFGVSSFASTVVLDGDVRWWDWEVDVKMEMVSLWDRDYVAKWTAKEIYLYD